MSYSTLFSQAQIKGEAPQPANGRCNVAFSTTQLPWPPQPNANPPTTPCGTQRAAWNIAPAIAPDGTIYTVTKAHLVTPLQLPGRCEFQHDRQMGSFFPRQAQ